MARTRTRFPGTPATRIFALVFLLGMLPVLRASSALESVATIRVSTSTAGAEADGASLGPALSADGRFVAFVSWATNLVPSDTNNLSDVFVRDCVSGGVVLASVASGGIQAQGDSWAPSLGADGRHVAFASHAWNLVGSDTNGVSDIFLRDLLLGATVRASVSSSGMQADGPSTNPVQSADGRFVAFESTARNLVAGDENEESDVFVRDLMLGTTERVSVGADGAEGSGASLAPSISPDCRFVSFASAAPNLAPVPGVDPSSWDVYLRDRVTGVTVRVSVSSAGARANGSSFAPSTSADGRFVAFESRASNLVPGDGNGRSDVFVRDLQSGTTSRVSAAPAGTDADGASTNASISADGRFVVFASEATNLVEGDENGARDVFFHDRQTSSTVRLSLSVSGAAAERGSSPAALSQDGRYAAFPYTAGDLVALDTNQGADIFLRGPLH